MLALVSVLRDRFERVRRFAEVVEEESGHAIEDLVVDDLGLGAKRELLGRTVEAATDARSAWKTRTLARAFVRGAEDGDLIDETLMFVHLLQNLEAAHARYLAAVDAFRHPVEIAAVGRRDSGLGHSAPFLWRRLVELGLLARFDEEQMRTDHEERSKAMRVHVGQGLDQRLERTPRLGPGVGLTELGQAAARWLEALDREK
jgi:hypothetical protein